MPQTSIATDCVLPYSVISDNDFNINTIVMDNENNCKISIALDSYLSDAMFVEMVNAFLRTFGVIDTIPDDIFFHGVFCKEITYAGFEGWEDAINDGVEVPSELYGGCNSESSKVIYVNEVIQDILVNGTKKPDWMTYVEENYLCEGLPPSTYLYIIAAEEYYENLATKIIDFLYSIRFSATTYCENEEGNPC